MQGGPNRVSIPITDGPSPVQVLIIKGSTVNDVTLVVTTLTSVRGEDGKNIWSSCDVIIGEPEENS